MGRTSRKIDAEDIQHISLEENVFMLFVGTNVTLFKGMLGFKTTSLTRWHVNIPIPQIEALRNSLGDKPYIIDWEETLWLEKAKQLRQLFTTYASKTSILSWVKNTS